MSETTEAILRSAIERSNKLNDQAAAHIQKVAETHVKIAERFIGPDVSVHPDVLKPFAGTPPQAEPAQVAEPTPAS